MFFIEVLFNSVNYVISNASIEIPKENSRFFRRYSIHCGLWLSIKFFSFLFRLTLFKTINRNYNQVQPLFIIFFPRHTDSPLYYPYSLRYIPKHNFRIVFSLFLFFLFLGEHITIFFPIYLELRYIMSIWNIDTNRK